MGRAKRKQRKAAKKKGRPQHEPETKPSKGKPQSKQRRKQKWRDERKSRTRRRRSGHRSEWVQFADELRESGLGIRDTQSDGNCMFRALSDQLYGNESLHRECRERIVDYMCRHSEEFAPFILGSFDSYTSKLRKSGNWGGHSEMIAATRVFQVDITLHQLGFASYQILCPPLELLSTESDVAEGIGTVVGTDESEAKSKTKSKSKRKKDKKKRKKKDKGKSDAKKDTMGTAEMEGKEEGSGDTKAVTKREDADCDSFGGKRSIRKVRIAFCDGRHYASVRPLDQLHSAIAPVTIYSDIHDEMTEEQKLATMAHRMKLTGFRDAVVSTTDSGKSETLIHDSDCEIATTQESTDAIEDVSLADSKQSTDVTLTTAIIDDSSTVAKELSTDCKTDGTAEIGKMSSDLSTASVSVAFECDAVSTVSTEMPGTIESSETMHSSVSASMSDCKLVESMRALTVGSTDVSQTQATVDAVEGGQKTKSAAESSQLGTAVCEQSEDASAMKAEDPFKVVCKCGSSRKWVQCCGKKYAKKLAKSKRRAKRRGSKKTLSKKERRKLKVAKGRVQVKATDFRKRKKKEQSKTEEEREDLYDGVRVLRSTKAGRKWTDQTIFV